MDHFPIWQVSRRRGVRYHAAAAALRRANRRVMCSLRRTVGFSPQSRDGAALRVREEPILRSRLEGGSPSRALKRSSSRGHRQSSCSLSQTAPPVGSWFVWASHAAGGHGCPQLTSRGQVTPQGTLTLGYTSLSAHISSIGAGRSSGLR